MFLLVDFADAKCYDNSDAYTSKERKMKYGLQLYSVRDFAEKDLEATLRQVAEMGYDMVESAGFFGHSADEVKAMLCHYGLTLCSTHTPYREVFDNFEATLDFHKRVGCTDLVLPSAPFATREDIDYTVDRINHFLPILKNEGIALHYHNHSGEFLKNQDGLLAENELAERTDVLFEIDTFWTFNAGLDPLKVLEQYRGRVKFIHLKDGIAEDLNNKESRAIGKSLGLGDAPVKAVRQRAIEMGLSIVVESENLEPNGPEEVGRCIEYLRVLDCES